VFVSLRLDDSRDIIQSKTLRRGGLRRGDY